VEQQGAAAGGRGGGGAAAAAALAQARSVVGDPRSFPRGSAAGFRGVPRWGPPAGRGSSSSYFGRNPWFIELPRGTAGCLNRKCACFRRNISCRRATKRPHTLSTPHVDFFSRSPWEHRGEKKSSMPCAQYQGGFLVGRLTAPGHPGEPPGLAQSAHGGSSGGSSSSSSSGGGGGCSRSRRRSSSSSWVGAITAPRASPLR
jgi:hypothetical protein